MISHDLFTMGIPIAEKAIRTVAVYAGIVIILRIAGKRDLAQLNTLDFVVMILLSNVVQNAIIGSDNSLSGGLLGAAILVGANSGFVRAIVADKGLGRIIEGSPTTVVIDGKFDHARLREVGLRPIDVDMAVRRQNGNSVDQVSKAVLEPSGALLVTIKDKEQNATKGDLAALERKLLAAIAAR